MTFHSDAHQLGGLESRRQDPSKQVLDEHVLLTGVRESDLLPSLCVLLVSGI